MTTNLHKFVEHIARKIDIVFNEAEEIIPLWHIVAGDGEELILPSLSDDKDTAILIAKGFMKAMNAKRYAFIDEGWMAHVKDESEIPVGGGVRHLPNRREVVMISAEDINEGSILAHCEIIRSKVKPYLGPLKFMEGGITEGRFLGLLPIPKLHS